MARLSAGLSLVGSILAGMTLLAPLGSAHAEAKIAVVNVPRLLDEAPQAKTAMQALQDEFAPRQKEIVQQQKELKTKEEKLTRDGAVMAENERRNAEKDLRDGQRELARKQNEYVEDLNLRRNEELAGLQERANKVIQQIAEAEKYDLILQDPVVYASQRIDITEKVIKALADK
jgi:outer membrane protein